MKERYLTTMATIFENSSNQFKIQKIIYTHNGFTIGRFCINLYIIQVIQMSFDISLNIVKYKTLQISYGLINNNFRISSSHGIYEV
jgi:hypothetical protein